MGLTMLASVRLADLVRSFFNLWGTKHRKESQPQHLTHLVGHPDASGGGTRKPLRLGFCMGTPFWRGSQGPVKEDKSSEQSECLEQTLLAA